MDTNIEKDCGALGGLFQTIISDMRGSVPIWEDFIYKSTKLNSTIRTTVMAIGAFLEAFQKVADIATGSKGATREIGFALTRLCMRHRSIEGKLKTFTSSIVDSVVSPLQDKIEEWKKVVAQLDKDHAKEYKKARQEIKKASSDTVRLQKKAKKVKGDMQHRLDNAMQEVTDKYLLLEESEKSSVRLALTEERGRFCHFVTCLKPFVDVEISLLSEISHLQEIMDSLSKQAAEPNVLPEASEQVIMDLKGLDGQVWNIQTPPSSPSSLGSRKSSMCSISSINSSSSGSTKSHSPSHHYRYRNGTQMIAPPSAGTIRLTSVSSQDSGFTSQDTLFLRPATPPSLAVHHQTLSDNSSTGTDTPDSGSTPDTPSSDFPSTPSVNSTWANWPNPPNAPVADMNRPHTISTAYEKTHSRPPLTLQLFDPPTQNMERAGSNSSIEQGKAGKPERPHSSIQQSHYARPSATITKMQPVLPPLGPKPKAKAVPPPVVPGHVILEDDQPLYVNMTELANMAYEKQQREQNSGDETPTAKAPPTSMTQLTSFSDTMDIQEAIRDLDNYTAALNSEYDSESSSPTLSQSSNQQNCLELAEAIRELQESTAALTSDSVSQASRTSLQCSSGYGTMNSTPSGSEDTIASGEYGPTSAAILPDCDKFFTVPRNGDFSNAFRRATLPSRRPASSAGIPMTNAGPVGRRSSMNSSRPPPPVRRTASISNPSPAVAPKPNRSPSKESPTQSQPKHKDIPTAPQNQQAASNHKRSQSHSGTAELTYAPVQHLPPKHSKDPQQHSRDLQQHSRDPQQHSKDPQQHSRDPQQHSRDPQQHSRDPQQHSKDPQQHSRDPQQHSKILQQHSQKHVQQHGERQQPQQSSNRQQSQQQGNKPHQAKPPHQHSQHGTQSHHHGKQQHAQSEHQDQHGQHQPGQQDHHGQHQHSQQTPKKESHYATSDPLVGGSASVPTTPQYAVPTIGLPGNQQSGVNVIQSLNEKFAAIKHQQQQDANQSGGANSGGPDPDFPLPPTDDEIREMEVIYSKPVAVAQGTSPSKPVNNPLLNPLLNEIREKGATLRKVSVNNDTEV